MKIVIESKPAFKVEFVRLLAILCSTVLCGPDRNRAVIFVGVTSRHFSGGLQTRSLPLFATFLDPACTMIRHDMLCFLCPPDFLLMCASFISFS